MVRCCWEGLGSGDASPNIKNTLALMTSLFVFGIFSTALMKAQMKSLLLVAQPVGAKTPWSSHRKVISLKFPSSILSLTMHGGVVEKTGSELRIWTVIIRQQFVKSLW
jgi:hypothetical protein